MTPQPNSYTAVVVAKQGHGLLLGGKFAHESPHMQQRSMAVAWAEGIIRINKAQSRNPREDFIIRESTLEPEVTTADVDWHDVTLNDGTIQRMPKPNDLKLLADFAK